MLTTMLDISRMEDHNIPINKETIDLREIVEAALRGIARTTSVSLIKEGFDAPLLVSCDFDITRRIIDNLLGNGLKFSESQGTIRITLGRNSDFVRCAISDTGSGIPPEYLDKIFEKFSRVEQGPESMKPGVGLGLTFCKMAIEAQGGRIGVESVLHEGSTFWIDIPARENPV